MHIIDLSKAESVGVGALYPSPFFPLWVRSSSFAGSSHAVPLDLAAGASPSALSRTPWEPAKPQRNLTSTPQAGPWYWRGARRSEGGRKTYETMHPPENCWTPSKTASGALSLDVYTEKIKQRHLRGVEKRGGSKQQHPLTRGPEGTLTCEHRGISNRGLRPSGATATLILSPYTATLHSIELRFPVPS